MKFQAIECQLKNNQPFFLNGTDNMWVVIDGEVELYYVERDKSGNILNSKSYIYSACKGEILFNLQAGSSHTPLDLFVVSMDAKMVQLNKRYFANLDPKQLVFKVENWIQSFSSFFAINRPPRIFNDMKSLSEIKLKNEAIGFPSKGIIWAELLEGDVDIHGDLPTIDIGKIKKNKFPVTRNLYVKSNGKSSLKLYTTNDIIEDEITLMLALEYLEQLFYKRIIQLNFESKSLYENNIVNKRLSDKNILDNNLNKLKSILIKDGAAQVIERSENNDLLLNTCQLIGDKVGFKFQDSKHHEEDENETGLTSKLHRITKVSKVRTRKVILRGEWYNQENGHLLAFTKESNDPVVLLQQPKGKYRLKNLKTGSDDIVDAEIAKELSPVSYMFLFSFDRKMDSLFNIWKFAIKGLAIDGVYVLVAALSGSLLGLLVPIITGKMYDDVIPQADKGFLMEVTLILLMIGLVSALIRLVRGILLLRLETKSNLVVQAGLMDHLLRLPVNFFKNYAAGDLTMRVLGINAIRQMLSSTVLTAILSGTFSLVNLGLLFYYSPKLAFVGIGLALVAMVFVVIIGLLKLKYDKQIAHAQGEIQGFLFEFLSGISKVRITGAEKRIFAKWADHFSNLKILSFRSGNYQNFAEAFNASYPLFTKIIFFGIIYSIVNSSGLTGSGFLSVGIFMAFISAFSQFLGDCLSMSFSLITSLNIIPYYERLKPILEAEPETLSECVDPGTLSGEIEFNSISFRYNEDQPLVLKDVSFKINPGEMVAFVGPSGSGKSTIMRLLLGFEEAEIGSIFYDGQSFDSLNKELVRKQTGVVLQHGALMPGSIFKNIIGNSELTLEQATQAAHMAGLEEDIEQMPMGMHTVVSDGASTFSGGQRQRLMIARAIVHKPRILYMDEATSALDNKTQTIVSESLARMQSSRIVIAHRLSTVMNADRIYVMDKGEIIQQGTYEELMETEGVFANLAKRQIA